MKFSKFNNPHRKHHRKKLDRCEADIMVAKMRLDDEIESIRLMAKGIEKRVPPMSYYDSISDQLCGQPSRHIY